MRWSLLLTLLTVAPVYGADGPLTSEVRQQLAGRYATYEVKSYLPPAGYAVKSFLPLSTPARVVPAPQTFRRPAVLKAGNYGNVEGHRCPNPDCRHQSERGEGTWLQAGSAGLRKHWHECPVCHSRWFH